MAIIDYNESVTLSKLVQAAMSVPVNVHIIMNRTVIYNNNSDDNITSSSSNWNNTSKNVSMTSTFLSLLSTPSSTEVDDLAQQNLDSAIISKITALLIITAVVLVISYHFVIRLFLGYADRKDEVIPDGLSDEEEDSGVIKPVHDSDIDF